MRHATSSEIETSHFEHRTSSAQGKGCPAAVRGLNHHATESFERKKERKGGINQSLRRLVQFCLKSIGCAEVADAGREIRKVFESK